MIMLLVCKSDTTIDDTVSTTSELGPDVWALERETLAAMVRESLEWYAGLRGAELRGPIRWELFDISDSVYPHENAPSLDSGVWG